MSNLSIFLNTRVESSGALAWIGNKGLSPVRYLFNGKTIRIISSESDEIEIHRVASFHKEGTYNQSRTKRDLESSSTGMIRTALSIVFLIPGLALGTTFKALAYLLSDIREKHHQAKEHLTPINREIGSADAPITTEEELSNALDALHQSNRKNLRPTNALIIHGKDLKINKEPGILQFNPMKLVLDGVKIVKGPSHSTRLSDAMDHSRKWKLIDLSDATPSNADDSVVDVHDANIKIALKTFAPRRGISCKHFHVAYYI